MTAEIINLRQARKARDRSSKEAQAEENRAKFGQSKAERQRLDAEADCTARRLDGAQRTWTLSSKSPRQVLRPRRDKTPPSGGAT